MKKNQASFKSYDNRDNNKNDRTGKEVDLRQWNPNQFDKCGGSNRAIHDQYTKYPGTQVYNCNSQGAGSSQSKEK